MWRVPEKFFELNIVLFFLQHKEASWPIYYQFMMVHVHQQQALIQWHYSTVESHAYMNTNLRPVLLEASMQQHAVLEWSAVWLKKQRERESGVCGVLMHLLQTMQGGKQLQFSWTLLASLEGADRF